MRVTASLPTGVTGLLFEGAARRRALENDLVERLAGAEFHEVILPVVDYLEPYEGLLSRQSRSELYRFTDRDGEVLALRADFTPMLARLIAPRLASLELPLRLFYRGDVLRYQEERAGGEREFYQLGAELLGLPGEVAEAEALGHFVALLKRGRRRRLVVVIGFAGALDALLLDHPDRVSLGAEGLIAGMARRQRSVARRGGAALLEVVEEGIPAEPTALGTQAANRLRALVELRDRLAAAHPEVEVRVDLAEFADQPVAAELRRAVGGRAYYDGLVFRAFGAAGAVPLGGGGRYDGLFRVLGADVSAAGFSISLDRLVSPGPERAGGPT